MMDELQLKELASQLGCPHGDNGLPTAENMAANNQFMISTAISALDLHSNDIVLEIGPGGGAHVAELFTRTNAIRYHAIDISPLMVDLCKQTNSDLVGEGRAEIHLSDGIRIDFPNDMFDKIFTVNTLYFWKEPEAYLREIERVLKPGGMFVLCFAPKSFMETLPFTQYGFKLYENAEVKGLLAGAGFTPAKIDTYEETVVAGTRSIQRSFSVIRSAKPPVY
ncbi:class I SAM-dependent methyltransferase [Pedobacter deserti]|uniref:class I SAM-dependent methyltransferase n=1 Tax=Pedobacter deserti TaxID=2817382 RepID=UPI0021092AB0|nr:class I SAM-dependent methyltransferase [Pedobacter sp. SYSU D00382]